MTEAFLAAEDAKNRGNALFLRSEFDEAARCYHEAIHLMPSYAEAYVNLGKVYMAKARYQEAEPLLKQAMVLKPELWQAPFNLGEVCEYLGKPDEAITCYQCVLNIKCSKAIQADQIDEAYWRLLRVLMRLKRYEESIALMKDVVAIHPEQAEAYCNIGVALNKLGRNEEAVAQFEQALRIQPQHAVAARFLGIAHQELQHWVLARHYFEQACQLNPENSEAQLDRALLSLLLGDYEQGWLQYEKALPGIGVQAGQVTDATVFRTLFGAEKYWQGDHLAGRTVLVWTEQGLGDSLMMLRYLPVLKDHYGAGRIIVICEQALMRIVQNLACVDEVFPRFHGSADAAQWDQYQAIRFNTHCSAMSLPCLTQTRIDTIPSRVPYIHVADGAASNWANRLAALPGLKVGFVWGGSKALAKDALRSIPLKSFEPLFNIKGITWVSLQKGERAIELAECTFPVMDWTQELQDMQDTAALLKNLDLTISVDTSIIHLAGALGLPAWLLNRYGSEWRWLLDREDSPWYPSLRIFRQSVSYEWNNVMTRVAKELEEVIHRTKGYP